MNREKLQELASEWVRLAKNDIRKKVIDFIEEVDTTPRELAYHLAISEGELDQIINGNGEITISTFAKLLIATGNALEIKPIDETPIGDYENIPTEEMFERPLPRPNIFERPRPRGFERRNAQQPTRGHFRNSFERQRPTFERRNAQQPTRGHFRNSFERQRPTFEQPNAQQPTRGHFMGPNPQMPIMGHFQSTPPIFPEDVEESNEQPRDSHGRFMSRNQAPTSPFAEKTVEELTKIIKERLWDSEIDLASASKNDLIKFLDEKDKRMKEYKRMKELEEDPHVNEFKNRMKRTLETNPHLRDWAKKFLGEMED